MGHRDAQARGRSAEIIPADHVQQQARASKRGAQHVGILVPRAANLPSTGEVDRQYFQQNT